MDYSDEYTPNYVGANKRRGAVLKITSEMLFMDEEDDVLLGGDFDPGELCKMAPEEKKKKAAFYKMDLQLPSELSKTHAGAVISQDVCDRSGRSIKRNFRGKYLPSTTGSVSFVIVFIWQTCINGDVLQEVALVLPRTWISKCFRYVKLPRIGEWYRRIKNPTTDDFMNHDLDKEKFPVEWDVSRYVLRTAYSSAEKAQSVCNAILDGLYVDGGSEFEGDIVGEKDEYLKYLYNVKNYTKEQVTHMQQRNHAVLAVMEKTGGKEPPAAGRKRRYVKRKAPGDEDKENCKPATEKKRKGDDEAGAEKNAAVKESNNKPQQQRANRGGRPKPKTVDDELSDLEGAYSDSDGDEGTKKSEKLNDADGRVLRVSGQALEQPAVLTGSADGSSRQEAPGIEPHRQDGAGFDESQNDTFSNMYDDGTGGIISRNVMGYGEGLPHKDPVLPTPGGEINEQDFLIGLEESQLMDYDAGMSELPDTQLGIPDAGAGFTVSPGPPVGATPVPGVTTLDSISLSDESGRLTIMSQQPIAPQASYQIHHFQQDVKPVGDLIPQAVAQMGGNGSTSSVVAEVLTSNAGASQAGANQYGGTQLYSSGTGVIQRSSNNDGLALVPHRTIMMNSQPSLSSSPLVRQPLSAASCPATFHSNLAISPLNRTNGSSSQHNVPGSSAAMRTPNSEARIQTTRNKDAEFQTPSGSTFLPRNPISSGSSSAAHRGNNGYSRQQSASTPSSSQGAAAASSGNNPAWVAERLRFEETDTRNLSDEGRKICDDIDKTLTSEATPLEHMKDLLKLMARSVCYITNVSQDMKVSVGHRVASELNRFRDEFLSRDSSPRRGSLAGDERKISSTFVNAPVEHNVKLPIETMLEFKQFDRLLETNSKAFDDFKSYLNGVTKCYEGLPDERIRACWVALVSAKLTLDSVWKNNGPQDPSHKPEFYKNATTVIKLFNALWKGPPGKKGILPWRSRLKQLKGNSRRLEKNKPGNAADYHYCDKWEGYLNNVLPLEIQANEKRKAMEAKKAQQSYSASADDDDGDDDLIEDF